MFSGGIETPPLVENGLDSMSDRVHNIPLFLYYLVRAEP